jgi:hypothetical protein
VASVKPMTTSVRPWRYSAFMIASGEVETGVVGDTPAEAAYRTAAASLRRCLDLADVAMEHHSAERAAEYLLGALDDLAPELAVLAGRRTR